MALVISHKHKCMAGVDSDGQGLLKPAFVLKTTRSLMVLCYCLGSPYSDRAIELVDDYWRLLKDTWYF